MATGRRRPAAASRVTRPRVGSFARRGARAMCLLSVAPCASVRVVEPTDDAVTVFARHLRSERGLSEHTRRAYLGDVAGLLAFAAERGVGDLRDLTLSDLRSWLAQLSDRGAARATVARRAAAARAFLRWAHHTGRIDSDPSLRLVAPRRTRTLPGVLRQDEATGLLDVAAVAADDDDPVHLRDRAVLELLYASGIRVGELVGLDVDDVDLGTDGGHGSSARAPRNARVPFGRPAARALTAWLDRWPAGLAAAESGPALFLGAAGPAIDPRRCASARARDARATSTAPPTSGRTACGTAPPRTCWRAARTCAPSRRCSATPAWRPRRSTPMCHVERLRAAYQQAHPRA